MRANLLLPAKDGLMNPYSRVAAGPMEPPFFAVYCAAQMP
jgi:hypothetical protein